MSAAPAGKLYTTQLLSLATQLGGFPLDDDLPYTAEERSRTCGSTIAIGLSLDQYGSVDRVGLRVSACAIGQASAAILALSAKGRRATDLAAMEPAITRWLAGQGPLPDWPGFADLEPALPHMGRHAALILPWKGARQALFNAGLAS
jgi:NifU-like protein involved in Fe-S cluster formation